MWRHERVDRAMRATSSGVTISGQAPCSALVASDEARIARRSGRVSVVVVVDPGDEAAADPR